MGLFDEGLPRPEVAPHDAGRWAQEHYGLTGDLRELGSQQDRNVLVSSSGGRFLLKVSNRASTREEVEAQSEAMRLVAAGGLDAPVPVRSLTGEEVVEVDIPRQRIALTMKLHERPAAGRGDSQGAPSARGGSGGGLQGRQCFIVQRGADQGGGGICHQQHFGGHSAQGHTGGGDLVAVQR